MTPAKIKEHEPTAVKREMTERIAEPGQTGTNSEEGAEIARKKVWLRELLVYPKLVTNTNKEPMAAGTMRANQTNQLLVFLPNSHVTFVTIPINP